MGCEVRHRLGGRSRLPILVDGDLITYTGSTIKRLDVNTGKVLAEGTMAGTSSFSINPATYADGMIFVGLSGGKIQAFNAKTLESLWIYTDPLGGQPNTSPTYHDGYIYVGFWNGESKPGNFVAISVTDEDPMKTDEAKLASWSYACVGGFYWAGAYVTDNLCIVGTDDGSGEGDYINTSALLVFDRLTGKLLDSHYGCKGDIRSNVSHDPDSDRVFFTSKGGYIYNAAIDWETGKITDFKSLALKDAEGYTSEEKPGAIMSTCTPSVYNGRIYLGVSGSKGQFSQNGGHCIEVIDLDTATGEMSYAYSYGIIGYPQTSAMVSTAYVDKDFDGDGAGDGYVFIYLPYNYTPRRHFRPDGSPGPDRAEDGHGFRLQRDLHAGVPAGTVLYLLHHRRQHRHDLLQERLLLHDGHHLEDSVHRGHEKPGEDELQGRRDVRRLRHEGRCQAGQRSRAGYHELCDLAGRPHRTGSDLHHPLLHLRL